MGIEIIAQHPTVKYSNTILKLCKPLEKLDITYFAEISVSKNGFLSLLSNRVDWSKRFLSKKYYCDSLCADAPSSFLSGHYLIRHLNRNAKHEYLSNEAKALFDIDHSIVFIEKNPGLINFYYFSGSAENTSIINFYLNNISLLKKFILFFKVKATNLRNLCISHPIHFENYQNILTSDIREEGIICDKKKFNFISEINNHHYLININGKNKKFSKREVDCIFCLLSGKTAREAADILTLSVRTVENYIDTIKTKLDCYRKSEVLEKLLPLNLVNYFNYG